MASIRSSQPSSPTRHTLAKTVASMYRGSLDWTSLHMVVTGPVHSTCARVGSFKSWSMPRHGIRLFIWVILPTTFVHPRVFKGNRIKHAPLVAIWGGRRTRILTGIFWFTMTARILFSPVATCCLKKRSRPTPSWSRHRSSTGMPHQLSWQQRSRSLTSLRLNRFQFLSPRHLSPYRTYPSWTL